MSRLYELCRAILCGESVSIGDIDAAQLDVNALDTKSHRTLLTAAAEAGRCDLIGALVDRGANLQQQSSERLTALHAAAFAGSENAVELLLSLGAEIDARAEGEITPLMCAAAWAQWNTVRMLIIAGADVSLLDDRGGTARDVAEEKHGDQMEAILQAFAV